MQLMLQQTQNLNILKSVQNLTAIAVKRQTNTIMAIKSSYINGEHKASTTALVKTVQECYKKNRSFCQTWLATQ